MKNPIVTLFAVFIGLSAFADNWVFTLNEGSATDGMVTDGVWTFNATIDASKQTIVFNRAVDDPETGYAVPTAVTAIDFSKDVVSQDGQTSYKIVSLGSGVDIHQGGGMFGYFGAHQNDPKTTAVAAFVGEVTFPGEGLTTIGDCAFLRKAGRFARAAPIGSRNMSAARVSTRPVNSAGSITMTDSL